MASYTWAFLASPRKPTRPPSPGTWQRGAITVCTGLHQGPVREKEMRLRPFPQVDQLLGTHWHAWHLEHERKVQASRASEFRLVGERGALKRKNTARNTRIPKRSASLARAVGGLRWLAAR
jgi:hypothetical protein